ncbi:MAG: T9SS type A sorting domain-containing protein [Bacteroidales bacterium]|nr:T9SS type A sorting domain-containing protein [Bacteroidales bacterium]
MKTVITFLIIVFISFNCLNLAGQTLEEKLAGKINYIVDINGGGNSTSLVAAINAAPNSSATPYVIFIRNGKYVEKVEIPSNKSNLIIIGESVDSAIISWNDHSGSGVIYNGIISSSIGKEIGTSTSHTLYIDADNVTIMNLTVENSAGDVGQAVAINLGADRTTVVRCRLMGNQDTFYTWGGGRFYIRDSFIEGDVDFIFGRGTALFDSCQINSNIKPNGGGHLTAASTDTLWKFGYVFRNCKATANPGVTGITLGRPWRPNAQTVFMNTFMDSHISAVGWTDWDGKSATCYYAEYNNSGPGYVPASRVAWSHQLDSAEASKYTIDAIFASDVNPSPFSSNWVPGYKNDSTYIILKNNTDLLYNDTSFNRPELVGLIVNDSSLGNFNAKTTSYSFVLPYGTVDVPSITALPLDSLASVTVTNPDALPGSAKVHVVSRNNAYRDYTIAYTIATGLSDLIDEMDFRLLTNPCQEALRFELSNKRVNKITAKIYSITGVILKSKVFDDVTDGRNTYIIDTGDLPNGIYILTLSANGSRASFKFLKDQY